MTGRGTEGGLLDEGFQRFAAIDGIAEEGELLGGVDVQQYAGILDGHFHEVVRMVPEESAASDVPVDPFEFGFEGSIDEDGVTSTSPEDWDQGSSSVSGAPLDEGVHRRGRDEGLVPEDDQVALGRGRGGMEPGSEGRVHPAGVLRIHDDRALVERDFPANPLRLRAEDHDHVSDPGTPDRIEEVGQKGTFRNPEQGLGLAHPR